MRVAMQTTTSDLDPYIEAFRHVVRDVPARRELLWILAMMKGDHRTAREFEELEPALLPNLSPIVSRHWRARRLSPRPGTERSLFDAIWDERLEHHLARFGAGGCHCPECGESS